MSEPKPELRDESENSAPHHEYVTHNFDAINHAIDADADRRNLMFSLYQSERNANKSQIFVNIAYGLSLILLTIAFITWLLSPSQGSVQIQIGDLNSSPSPIESLEVLAQAAEEHEKSVEEGERAFIDTSFTVFSRVIQSNGEYVVTGRTYAPDDLKQPLEQYCYLEKTKAGNDLAGVPLAIVANGKFVAETKDEYLLALAKKNCQFTHSD